jgi:hypothetical protein
MRAATGLAWAALGLGMAAGAWAQGGPDELWNMSTRMEMAGMPAQAMNHQVCMKKGETQPEKMSQDQNCKVTEQRKVGNTFTWKIVCTGRDAMTGEGRMTRSGNAMDGRMRMQGKSGGEPLDMTIVYTGKLAGGCNAGERQQAAVKQQQAMIAQGEAQTAQVCKESMDKYMTMMFEGEGAICKAQKPQFCARVTKTTQAMRTPAGYRKSAKSADWEQVGKVCKVNMASVRASACKNGVGGRDWDFVGDYCPAESKKIAAEHCAGRDYTAAMASEYKAICGRYARRGAEDSPAAAAQPAAPSAADTVKSGVKEGASQLRKLFGR